MLTTATQPASTALVLPHEDVVLFALVHVANLNQVHPWSLGMGIFRRPALMAWIGGNTVSPHYSIMRQIIVKLANKYDVQFFEDGFSVAGREIIRCKGIAPPVILANPSAL